MTPHDLIANWLSHFEPNIKAAGKQFDKDMEAASLELALDEAGFLLIKRGTKCPFDKDQPDPGLSSEDPCPICGDLGTLDQDRPSRCIG